MSNCDEKDCKCTGFKPHMFAKTRCQECNHTKDRHKNIKEDEPKSAKHTDFVPKAPDRSKYGQKPSTPAAAPAAAAAPKKEEPKKEEKKPEPKKEEKKPEPKKEEKKPEPAAAPSGPAPPKVQSYDAFYQKACIPFIETCKALGGACVAVGQSCEALFGPAGLRRLMEATANCKKPKTPELQAFAAPMADVVSKAAAVLDNRSPFFAHQSAWSEVAQSLTWIYASPPLDTIQAQLESADFHLNKILTSAKDMPDPAKGQHRAYVKQLKDILGQLKGYIKEHHTAGLTWNGKGVELSAFTPSEGGPAPAPAEAKAAEGAPEGDGSDAPPPPPMVTLDMSEGAPAPTGDKPAGKPPMGAVFAQLNQGEKITSGLKHVTKDMKAEKNKHYGALKDDEKKEKKEDKSEKKEAAAKPPSTKLNDNKWFVEYHTEASGVIELTDVQMTHSVYIFKCKNCAVKISGKLKTVTIDSCQRVQVQFDDIVSSVEVVNCERPTIFAMGVLPSISIDKTNGLSLHLSEPAANCKPNMFTSCISECNVVIPGKLKGKDDEIEMPIAEQFVTSFTPKWDLKTEPKKE